MSTLVADVLAIPPSERRRLLALYDPWTWARETARVQLKRADGRPGLIDLTRHPFLRDVYRDTHAEIVVMKGAQLGFSTTAMLRAFWMLTTYPCSVIYTFPTSTDVTNYTAARINPLIGASPYLNRRIVDVNSVTLKQFGVTTDEVLESRAEWPKSRRFEGVVRSTVYFRGASSEKDAISVDADLLIFDEEDLANPQIVEQFESRLDASRFKWKFRLSTPRIPGAGIDRIWQTTDKRHWFVHCSRCNLRFEMAFPGGPWTYSNIEPDVRDWKQQDWDRWDDKGRPARYVCHGCGKELSEEDRADGEWVPEKLSQVLPHGYSVSQMAAPWVSAQRILERKMKATWDSDFWNLVMGIAWDEGVNAFSEKGVLSRCGDRAMVEADVGPCFMGVDVGAKMDVVVGKWIDGRPVTIKIARLDTYAELDRFMDRYHVVQCVIDASPEEHATRAWADKYNRYPTKGGENGRIRVWRQWYGVQARPGQSAQLIWNEKLGTVGCPRTEILSRSADELLEERVLPRNDGSDEMKAYVAHHVNSKKVAVWVEGLEAEKIKERDEWHEIGPDHLFHAATYEMIARLAPRGPAAPKTGLISLQRSTDQRPREPAGETWGTHRRGG